MIAEKDLALRGGGDPLGLKQSGFPDYRFADPAAHRDLIAAAADDARLILHARSRPDQRRAARRCGCWRRCSTGALTGLGGRGLGRAADRHVADFLHRINRGR